MKSDKRTSPIRFEIEHINGVTDRFVKYKIFVVAGADGTALDERDPLCTPRNLGRRYRTFKVNLRIIIKGLKKIFFNNHTYYH